MTTKVTVDAHAGWPVRVTNLSPDGGFTDVLVDPNTVQEFYVHDGKDIRIHEVQPNEKPSFGDIAVGRAFNPSGASRVDRLKALYAETAQMRAVKAATWKSA